MDGVQAVGIEKADWKLYGGRLRPANNDVALFGDSRMAYGFIHDSDGTTVAGAPGEYFTSVGLPFWLTWVSNGALRFLPSNDFGVAGNTTTQMLARIAPVLASSAGIVVLLGGVNDVSNGITQAQTQSNLVTMANMLAAAGKIVVLIPELPQQYFSGNSRQLHHNERNYFRFKLWNNPGVYVCDPWDSLTDQTDANGQPVFSYSFDGTHYGAAAYQLIAQKIWGAISGVVPAYDALSYSLGDSYDVNFNPLGNLCGNSTMQGTSGTLAGTPTPTGTVATSFQCAPGSGATNATGLTIAASQQTVGNKTLQRTVLSGTPSGARPQVYQRQFISQSLVSPGDVIEAAAFVQVNNSVGLAGLFLDCYVTTSSQSYHSCCGFDKGVPATAAPGTATYALPNFTGTGVLRTPRFTIPQGLTLTSFIVSLTAVGITGVATSADYAFGNVSVRKNLP